MAPPSPAEECAVRSDFRVGRPESASCRDRIAPKAAVEIAYASIRRQAMPYLPLLLPST